MRPAWWVSQDGRRDAGHFVLFRTRCFSSSSLLIFLFFLFFLLFSPSSFSISQIPYDPGPPNVRAEAGCDNISVVQWVAGRATLEVPTGVGRLRVAFISMHSNSGASPLQRTNEARRARERPDLLAAASVPSVQARPQSKTLWTTWVAPSGAISEDIRFLTSYSTTAYSRISPVGIQS